MAEEVKVVAPEKIPAPVIMEQLGYSRAPKKVKRQTQRQLHKELKADNSGSNGAAIARFDGFFASVRVVKVQHKRNAALAIARQLEKARALGRLDDATR